MRKMMTRLSLGLCVGLATLGVGCGGGGEDEAAPAATAAGAETGAVTVSVTDATGKTVYAVTDAQGNYQVDLAGLSAPLALSASGADGTLLDKLPVDNRLAAADATAGAHAQAITGAGEFIADPSKLGLLDKNKVTAALAALYLYLAQQTASTTATR